MSPSNLGQYHTEEELYKWSKKLLYKELGKMRQVIEKDTKKFESMRKVTRKYYRPKKPSTDRFTENLLKSS